jgi:hypothetical protein
MHRIPPAPFSARLRRQTVPSRPAFLSRHRVVNGLMSCLIVSLLLGSSTMNAQSSRPGLISQAVIASDRVALPAVSHPSASTGVDRGAVAASLPADRMLLLLKRSPEQERALRIAIEAQHDKNSPQFHKWLTPAQFGAQWGAVDSDVAAVTAWLQSQGFTVKGLTAGRTAIEFSGTVGQVQQAFQTEIHAYQLIGESDAVHHAAVTAPQIPRALAPVVAGVSMLNDFKPRSTAIKGPRGVYDQSTQKAHLAANSFVRPELTASTEYGPYLYVGPSDAATIYNMPNKALNPAATGTTYDGTGATIGIVGDSNISLDQLANYRRIFGLAANPPTVIIDGGTDPGENADAVEAYLDTEVANGIAPNAKVYFYTAADTNLDYGLNLAMLRAVNDNLVDVLNVSFGECEAGLSYTGNVFYEALWEQAAAQGISVTVSSGDSGSAGCDDPNKETAAIYGLQVNGIASTPYDIAVGGTDFAALLGPDGSGANFTNYVSTTSAAGTLRSAKSYIPEVPWDNGNSVFPPGPVSTYSPFTAYSNSIVAGGGGESNCSAGYISGASLVCNGAYQKPSWQAGTGVPATYGRDLPDVSLFAANGLFSASWAICTDQDTDANGNPITDCTPGSDGLPTNEFNIYGVGGTSASAPAFAGILALIRQATGERQGQADYALYNIARTVPSAFHDTTTGNNSVPCTAGTTNCEANSTGAYVLTGYNAGKGYDEATGLGSVDASALISNWASAGLSSTTTTLSIAPVSFEHGTVVDLNATVTSGAGTPTGNVAVAATANPPSFPLGVSIGTYPLQSGGSTGDLSLNYLPGGTYQAVATYGGSEAFSQSSSAPVSVSVTPESSATLITYPAYNPTTSALAPAGTIPYGYFVNLTAQPYGKHSPIVNGAVVPDGVATGNVAFFDGGTTIETDTLSSLGYAVAIGHYLTGGNHVLGVQYSGDPSFLPSLTKQTVTVTKAVTGLTMTASATKFTGKPIVFTVNLTTQSAGIAPTGTVALETGSTILTTAPLVGVDPTASTVASGSATISFSTYPSGVTEEIHAVYLGDTNYAPSTSNNVSVEGGPTFTLSSITLVLPNEYSTGAGQIVATSKGGYTGTINYSCVITEAPSGSTAPLCAMNPKTEVLAADGVINNVILIFGQKSKLPPGITLGSNQPSPGTALWLSAGGATLACCLFFGIPARKRSWKALLSMILLFASIAGVSGCTKRDPFITAGQYTYLVTGTDSQNSQLTTTATVNVLVK